MNQPKNKEEKCCEKCYRVEGNLWYCSDEDCACHTFTLPNKEVNSSEEKSKCCNELAVAQCDNKGILYYKCSNCGNVCDISPVLEEEKKCMCGLEKNSPYNHSYSCPKRLEKEPRWCVECFNSKTSPELIDKGCKHYQESIPQEPMEWVERIDIFFDNNYTGLEGTILKDWTKKLISFQIKQAEERERERIVKEIEKLKKPLWNDNKDKYIENVARHNLIDELKSIITNQ